MLDIEDEALKHLVKMLQQGPPTSAIRIAVMGGPNGVGLGLMLDEQGKDDTSIIHEKIPFLIDSKLLDYCGTISIKYTQEKNGSCVSGNNGALLINSENPL